jgi:hypothetical protein
VGFKGVKTTRLCAIPLPPWTKRSPRRAGSGSPPKLGLRCPVGFAALRGSGSIYQTERATRLAELKQLGQKVYALSWTSPQRSAFWALWRARGQAVLEDTERRIARVRKAVAKIRQAGPQLPSLGKRLFAFAKAKPMFSPRRAGP